MLPALVALQASRRVEMLPFEHPIADHLAQQAALLMQGGCGATAVIAMPAAPPPEMAT
jgi:hypothetical protein